MPDTPEGLHLAVLFHTDCELCADCTAQAVEIMAVAAVNKATITVHDDDGKTHSATVQRDG